MRLLVAILALRLVAAGAVLSSLAELERNPHVILGTLNSDCIWFQRCSDMRYLEKREPQGLFGPMSLNELRTFNAKPVAREILKPVLRPDATRVRVYYGPYNIFGQAVCALSSSKITYTCTTC
jgi:hypothetical protein